MANTDPHGRFDDILAIAKTYADAAHVFTRRASRALVHAAYFRRSQHQGTLCR